MLFCVFQGQGILISKEVRTEIGFKYHFSAEVLGPMPQLLPNTIS